MSVSEDSEFSVLVFCLSTCSEDSETENTMDTNQSSGDEHISDNREQGEQEMDEGNQKDMGYERKAEEESIEGQEEQARSQSDSNI